MGYCSSKNINEPSKKDIRSKGPDAPLKPASSTKDLPGPVEAMRIRDSNQTGQETINSSILAECHRYNVIVWSSAPEDLEKYSVSPTLFLTTRDKKATCAFMFFPMTSTSPESTPTVIDGILLILSSAADIPAANSQLTHFQKSWAKKILANNPTLEIAEFASSLSETPYSSEYDLLLSIYQDDLTLHSLVTEVFKRFDSDGNGLIDLAELKAAAAELGETISEHEAETTISALDLDGDGLVSFNEFLYWWKRGRQGGKSVHKLLGTWAEKLSGYIPGSTELLRSLGMKRQDLVKKYSQKTLELTIGPSFNTVGLSLECSLGKSSRREQLLNNVNSLLELNVRQYWGVIELHCQTALTESFTQEIETLLLAGYYSEEAASYDGEIISEFLGFKVKSEGNRLFIGCWVEMSHEKLQDASNKLGFIEELVKSPVDDSAEIEIKTSATVETVLGENWVSALESGMTAKMTVQNWVNSAGRLGALELSRELLYFLLFSGTVKIRAGVLSEVSGAVSEQLARAQRLLAGLKGLIRKLLGKSLLISSLVNKLKNELTDEFVVHTRMRNIGAKVVVKGPGVINYFTND